MDNEVQSKKMKEAKVTFDDLTAEQVGKLFPIQVVPYNPDWIMLFEQEKVLITDVLGEKVALNVEHFGSTSVVGLAAKPTIDILVETHKLTAEMKQVITKKLETIGYGNMHNVEQENKMTFGKGYGEDYACTQTYHVHIREKGDMPQEEIYFRDFLRQNADVRDEYAKLKYILAERYQFNREEYTKAKTEFIVKITVQQKKKRVMSEIKQMKRAVFFLLTFLTFSWVTTMAQLLDLKDQPLLLSHKNGVLHRQV